MAITQVYMKGDLLWVFTDIHSKGLAVDTGAWTDFTARSTPQDLEKDKDVTRIYGDAPKDAKLREIDGYLVGHPVESNVYSDPGTHVTAWDKNDPNAGKWGGLTGANSVERAWKTVAEFSKDPKRQQYVRPLLAVIKWFEMEGEK